MPTVELILDQMADCSKCVQEGSEQKKYFEKSTLAGRNLGLMTQTSELSKSKIDKNFPIYKLG